MIDFFIDIFKDFLISIYRKIGAIVIWLFFLGQKKYDQILKHNEWCVLVGGVTFLVVFILLIYLNK